MLKKIKSKLAKFRTRWNLFSIIAVVLLSVYALSLVFALLWALISSFKSRFDFREHLFTLPSKWHFDNYLKAFKELYIGVETSYGSRYVYMPELLFNTIVYSLGLR